MFFDVKNHLLPDTEPFCECAQGEDMAVCMAIDAYRQGCRFIMATPPDIAFWNKLSSPNAKGISHCILTKYQSLRNRILRSMPDMSLGLGCEIYCSRANIENVISHLKKGHYPTMNNPPTSSSALPRMCPARISGSVWSGWIRLAISPF